MTNLRQVVFPDNQPRPGGQELRGAPCGRLRHAGERDRDLLLQRGQVQLGLRGVRRLLLRRRGRDRSEVAPVSLQVRTPV